MPLYDAHNHLQDPRLRENREAILSACRTEGIAGMVVNGTSEQDWDEVVSLAREVPEVHPSLGLHPWWVPDRSPAWLDRLTRLVEATGCAIGEIGLDRWKKDLPYTDQEDVFLAQLALGAERNRPVSIHCLQAWGRLLELLETNPLPPRGFLLHSYGGSAEMVDRFAPLGAYFSIPGYYLHPRKDRAWRLLDVIPTDRLLLETDAPDQGFPEHLVRHPLPGYLNHPANLPVLADATAAHLGMTRNALEDRLAANHQALFGAQEE
jgi:TatD DNase family protein